MADERDAMLREMAKHRGLRLVKSRRRKPGGDFGRYGLADAKTGQDCFGIGKHGLEANADEIEDYLRRAAKADWKRSLRSAGKAAVRPKPKKREEPEQPAAPDPDPEPELEPELVVREARLAEADAIGALVGSAMSPAATRSVLKQLVQAGEAPLVAEQRGLVGCAAYHLIPTLQHGPIGRISLLLVQDEARRRGVGTRLLEAVEARLAERGCALVEAVGDIDLAGAQGFFRKRGYRRTSYRFAKPANQ